MQEEPGDQDDDSRLWQGGDGAEGPSLMKYNDGDVDHSMFTEMKLMMMIMMMTMLIRW